MEDNKKPTTQEPDVIFEQISEEDKEVEDTGFEKVNTEYSSNEASQSIVHSFFPFTKPGKQKLYEKLACIVAIAFMAVPGVLSILSWFLPRADFLNFIATQTASFLEVVTIFAIAVFAWLAIGRIADCAVNKKQFLPYSSFKEFVVKNKVRCLFCVFLVLLLLACLFGLNTQKELDVLKEQAEVAQRGNTAVSSPNVFDYITALFGNDSFSNGTDGFKIWIYIAIGAALVSLVSNRKNIRFLLIIFCASAVCTCVTMYIQYVVYYKGLKLDTLADFFRLWSVDFTAIVPDTISLRNLRGVFSNSNHYGYFLTLSTLAAAGLYVTGKKWWHRLLSGLAFAVMIFTLVLNDTLGTQLAVVIAVVLLPVFLIKSRLPIYRRFMPLVFMVVVMALMTAFPKTPLGSNVVRNSVNEFFGIVNRVTGKSALAEDADAQTETDQENRWWLKNQDLGTSRLGLWQYGIHLIGERPLLGWGIYSTNDIVKTESGLNSPAARVHNEYLQIGIDAGIPAMIIYLVALVLVVIHFFRAMKAGTLDNTQRILFGMFVAYSISAFMGIWAYYTACYNLIWLALLVSTFEGKIGKVPTEKALATEGADVDANLSSDSVEEEYPDTLTEEDYSTEL